MSYLSLTDRAKSFIAEVAGPGDLVIDATLGNGHDALFLARLVGPEGLVLGFDIQQRAIELSRQRLEEAGYGGQVHLILDGHEHLGNHLPLAKRNRVSAVMFNLGYQPGGDKSRTTEAKTTLGALDACRDLLKQGGGISILSYRGHPGSKEESEAVANWVGGLAPSIWQTRSIEPDAAENPPRLFCCRRSS